MTNDGILAIWHGVDDAIGEEYEQWYFGEHLPERVGVPGFVAGRRYEALSGTPRFLTFYEGESPAVFVSRPYLERLGDPTPMTARVLRHFRDTNRTVCRRTFETGAIRGAWAVTARVDRGAEHGAAGAAAEALREQGRVWARDWRVLRVEGWEPAPLPPPAPTAETRIRGAPDRSIAAAVLAHLAREADARETAQTVQAVGGVEVGVYRLLCELRSG